MSVTFSKAPLVEIVAELKWGSAQANIPQIQAGIPILVQSPNQDEFFMRFGGEIYQKNFKKSERLIPSGFPIILHQVVYRYSKEKIAEGDSALLYQIGAGVFSANATPPYHSWDEFSPIVRGGVEALLASRLVAEKESPFTCNLRYIDAFGEYFNQGMDIETFAREVLGISLVLPAPIAGVLQAGKKIKPHIQLQIPVDDNTNMYLLIAEAVVGGELSILLDCTVSKTNSIAPNSDDIMKVFTESRQIIHTMFVSLTSKIHALMEPFKEQGK